MTRSHAFSSQILKGQAQRLRCKEGISHSQALNRVAQSHGYTNWSAYLGTTHVDMPNALVDHREKISSKLSCPREFSLYFVRLAKRQKFRNHQIVSESIDELNQNLGVENIDDLGNIERIVKKFGEIAPSRKLLAEPATVDSQIVSLFGDDDFIHTLKVIRPKLNPKNIGVFLTHKYLIADRLERLARNQRHNNEWLIVTSNNRKVRTLASENIVEWLPFEQAMQIYGNLYPYSDGNATVQRNRRDQEKYTNWLIDVKSGKFSFVETFGRKSVHS